VVVGPAGFVLAPKTIEGDTHRREIVDCEIVERQLLRVLEGRHHAREVGADAALPAQSQSVHHAFDGCWEAFAIDLIHDCHNIADITAAVNTNVPAAACGLRVEPVGRATFLLDTLGFIY
jgi:hypothetical protein